MIPPSSLYIIFVPPSSLHIASLSVSSLHIASMPPSFLYITSLPPSSLHMAFLLPFSLCMASPHSFLVFLHDFNVKSSKYVIKISTIIAAKISYWKPLSICMKLEAYQLLSKFIQRCDSWLCIVLWHKKDGEIVMASIKSKFLKLKTLWMAFGLLCKYVICSWKWDLWNT